MEWTAILLGAATITLAMLHPEPGAAEPPVTSNLMVPLDLVVEGVHEDIAVTGTLHVVTDVWVNEEAISLRVHTNFVKTKGTGLNTNNAYSASGSQTLNTNIELPAPEQPPYRCIVLTLSHFFNNRAREATDMLACLAFNMGGSLLGVTVERFPLPCD